MAAKAGPLRVRPRRRLLESRAMKRWRVRRAGNRGMTLVEVMVAGFLLLIVFDYLSQFYYRGRRQLDYEEDRRKATAVASMRLDTLRGFAYNDLPGLDDTDTTYVVDGADYVVHHIVAAGTPEPEATTITVTVEWTAKVGLSNVARTMETTTILSRS